MILEHGATQIVDNDDNNDKNNNDDDDDEAVLNSIASSHRNRQA